jgi:hypothetical protein
MGKLGDRRDVFCYFSGYSSFSSIAVVNVPHHVTQRGNARFRISENEGDIFDSPFV